MYIKQGVNIEIKNGGYCISSVVNGYRLSKYYIGYTKKQAYKMFSDLTKSINTTNGSEVIPSDTEYK